MKYGWFFLPLLPVQGDGVSRAQTVFTSAVFVLKLIILVLEKFGKLTDNSLLVNSTGWSVPLDRLGIF